MPKIKIKCLSGSPFLHDLIYRKELFKRKNRFWYFLLKVNFEWRRHRWLKNDVKTLDWWRHSQKGVSKCYEQRISITWNENRRYKTMTTDYSYLYNQSFLVFIHPKITCQLAMTNDWEILIEGSKWAQTFRKHVKINLIPWKIAAGHRPNSIFHNKKNAAGWVKLPHPIRNRVYHYTFIVSLDKCNGNCNSVDNLSTKIYISSKTKVVNIKVVNMIKKENMKLKQKNKIYLGNFKCKFNSASCNLNQKWNISRR